MASAVAAEVAKLDGVSAAVSSYDLSAGRVSDTPQMRSVLNSYHPKRSGDIFIVFEPHRFVSDMDGLTVASMHGSPWSYDTFVPIFFAGPGIQPRAVHRAMPLRRSPAHWPPTWGSSRPRERTAKCWWRFSETDPRPGEEDSAWVGGPDTIHLIPTIRP